MITSARPISTGTIEERLSAANDGWQHEQAPRYECAFCGMLLRTPTGHRAHQRDHMYGTSPYRPIVRYVVPLTELSALCAASRPRPAQ